MTDLVNDHTEQSTHKAKRSSPEDQLEHLIRQRHELFKDADEADPRWLDSVHRHAEQLREANHAEWSLHHERLAVLHTRLADEHRAKAAEFARTKPPVEAGSGNGGGGRAVLSGTM
ncbi:MAG: hypothetical protein M3358_12680 [Actinomycetota bacterium]|nr:hypothetical protein [Actinomycetota bacterium]